METKYSNNALCAVTTRVSRLIISESDQWANQRYSGSHLNLEASRALAGHLLSLLVGKSRVFMSTINKSKAFNDTLAE